MACCRGGGPPPRHAPRGRRRRRGVRPPRAARGGGGRAVSANRRRHHERARFSRRWPANPLVSSSSAPGPSGGAGGRTSPGRGPPRRPGRPCTTRRSPTRRACSRRHTSTNSASSAPSVTTTPSCITPQSHGTVGRFTRRILDRHRSRAGRLVATVVVMARPSAKEERDGVPLTNLDQPLFDGADATKRDLVDYLDAVRDRILPVLRAAAAVGDPGPPGAGGVHAEERPPVHARLGAHRRPLGGVVEAERDLRGLQRPPHPAVVRQPAGGRVPPHAGAGRRTRSRLPPRARPRSSRRRVVPRGRPRADRPGPGGVGGAGWTAP